MDVSIAYLGPTGTNSETAALSYLNWLVDNLKQHSILCPYPSIALALQSVAKGKINKAVVPIENSIEGSVTVVLDAFWHTNSLQVEQELTIPIFHGLLSYATSLATVKTVYSHPQALAQCQKWLENYLPQAQLVPTKSTTEGIKFLADDLTAAAISAPRAAELYRVPLLKPDIKDSPDNCTRFWVVSCNKSNGIASLYSNDGTHLSLGFSLPKNAPGALMQALEIFARREINLSKIESRPSKRSLGEYIFLIDLEGNSETPKIKKALAELSEYAEVLKIFGNYTLLDIN